MKVNKFDTSNAKSAFLPGECTMRFSKAGQISFSKGLAAELKITAGTKACVMQDEEKPEDWYLIIGDKDGFNVRKYKSYKTDNYGFNNAITCKSMMLHWESPEAVSIGFRVETTPTPCGDPDYDGGGIFYALDMSNPDIKVPDDEEEEKPKSKKIA